MTSATPKPRAGEHVLDRQIYFNLREWEEREVHVARIVVERDALREALIEAQRRLNDAKLKGRGNDFYAAIVAVEQDLRAALGKA